MGKQNKYNDKLFSIEGDLKNFGPKNKDRSITTTEISTFGIFTKEKVK